MAIQHNRWYKYFESTMGTYPFVALLYRVHDPIQMVGSIANFEKSKQDRKILFTSVKALTYSTSMRLLIFSWFMNYITFFAIFPNQVQNCLRPISFWNFTFTMYHSLNCHRISYLSCRIIRKPFWSQKMQIHTGF